MSYDVPFGQDPELDARRRANAARTRRKIVAASKIAKEEGFIEALEPFGPQALENIRISLEACGDVMQRVQDAIAIGDTQMLKDLQPTMTTLLAQNKHFLERRFGSSVQRGKVTHDGKVTLSLGEAMQKRLAAVPPSTQPEIEYTDVDVIEETPPDDFPPAA